MRDPFSQFELDGWQRVAGKYESAWSSLTRLFIPHLLAAASVHEGSKLLDVACGPGYVAEAASLAGAVATGVDFCSQMVDLAKLRNPRMKFEVGDAQSLTYDDESFDIAVMNFGVLHLSQPETAFSEAYRVLRNGGHFAFSVWAAPENSPGAAVVEAAVTAHANVSVELPKGPDYFGYGDKESCREILSKVGFNRASVTFQTVIEEWQVPTASFVFESELDAGVRTAALLAAQDAETLAKIRSDIESGLQRFAKGDGFSIPFGAHIVAVTK